MADEQQNIKLNFDTNAKTAAGDVNKLAGSLDNVEDSAAATNKAMHGLDATFDEVYEGMKPLTARMGEAEDRLYELALAGKQASDEYKGLLESVANYKKTQQDTDRVVDAAATTIGEKLGGASQIAATGIQGITAGMAIFGDQSEDTEKALLKVQAAMAFSDAISDISSLSGQFTVLKDSVTSSAIAQKANTAATGAAAIVQNIFTGSVTTTTAGFKALKFAIAATGIGLLVVGLVAVYQNFDKIAKFATKLVPGLEGIGDAVMSIVNAVTDFIGITSEADRAMDRIKQNADQSIALNKKFLAEHESQLDEFTKQKLAAKDKYNEAIKEDGANQVALALELNRQLAGIEQKRQDEFQKKRDEAAKKAAEAQEKINEAALKKQQEAAKKKQDAYEKELQDAADFRLKMLEQADKIETENFEKSESNKAAQIDEIDAEFARMEKQEGEKLESEKAADEAALKQKEENKQRLISIGESGLSAAKDLFGKSKAVQKGIVATEGAIALGKVAISTVEAVGKDNAASPLTFGLPWSAVHIATGAIGAASIISNTNKQLQALGGGSISAGSSGASSSRSSSAPQVAFNNTSENQIGQSVARTQAEQPALQVTVLESDITKSQNNVKVLEKTNTF